MRAIIVVGLCIVGLISVQKSSAQSALVKPVELTSEFRLNPVGIATPDPVFGWTLRAISTAARNVRQSGYRIRLASSPGRLLHRSSLIWDSGRIGSSVYWQRPYTGPALNSRATYYWQVQAWSDGELPGPWSETGRFTTALLSESDWTAHWIAAQSDRPVAHNPVSFSADPPALPVFRHDFAIHKPIANALLFVAGLGQYEVHLNGSNVTDTVLNSGWTNYRKTVPYDTYDVGKLIHIGANAFGVLLGNGMYNVEDVKGHYTKFSGSFGQPKCLLQLEIRYADGTSERFTSDRSWQTHTGPLLFSSIYGGEEFDARVLPRGWDRAGFRTDGWQRVLEVAGPGGRLAAEQSPPMVVATTYPTVRTTKPKPGVTVYDLGQNMSGWPRITVRGPAGSKVRMLAGELLNPDGTVTQKSANAFPDAPVIFSYILRGGRRASWHPRFAYYSFRYVQVTVEPSGGYEPQVLSLAGDFVHARAPVAGHFESSSELFQHIHVLIDRAVLSNLASVVTDCPSREKLGWLEQTYLNAATLMLNYNVTGLYEKMSDDMRDSQLPVGLVPSIAPEFVAFVDDSGKSNDFRDSPEWGSAVILSPWALYSYTGDRRPLRDNYASMQKYAAYLAGRSNNGLLDYGLGDWYDIGPQAPGPSQLTSKMVTATGVYYEDLVALAQIAALLGRSEDATTYAQQAIEVHDAFNAMLFHPETNQYDRGSQTANALPLALGLVPAEHARAVLDNLVADIHAHGDHVTSGDVGFHYVVRALTDNGLSDVIAAMLSRTDSPSYGYQLARGATTLTEAWDANPESSQNHFMLGHGEEWLYRGLAGISIDMARGPEDAIRLQPSFLHGVSHASASFQAPMGLVKIGWKRVGLGGAADITVPAGAVAHLKLPAGTVWHEGATGGTQATDVTHKAENSDGLELTIGSGSYRFTANILPDIPPYE